MNEEMNLISVVTKERNNIQSIAKSLKSIERMSLIPEKNLYKINTEIKKIEKKLETNNLIESIKQDITDYVQVVCSKIPEWEEKTKKAFWEELETTLTEAGFELRGNYTRLMVSFYTLELDLENLKVIIWYGNKQEKAATCRLNPDDVVKKLIMANNKIINRAFDEEIFMEKLFEAYSNAIHKNKESIGKRVSISDVLFEYTLLIQKKTFNINPTKSNFTGYERSFFSYDLFRLKQRKFGDSELNLVTATRSFTHRKADFLWIPSDEKGEGDYISHIIFKED
ncbi:MAG: hypothetical protein K8S23_06740 [Candidatus Cloacimonetes bacterium]|nr:hypothetical protein [Candidatus Cloacimonadota bacterium]